jgi:hypothetical protein
MPSRATIFVDSIPKRPSITVNGMTFSVGNAGDLLIEGAFPASIPERAVVAVIAFLTEMYRETSE